jgi:dTDP-glucose 4,6-dehydratase
LKAGSLGTFHTLDLALIHHARFVFASTSEIYGDPLEHPQMESYWGHVNPVGPRSMYDEAKRFSEALIMAYYRSKGADTRIVRIFNTYGPRMRLDDGRVVPSFIQQALNKEPLTIFGDGMQTRSFCYVDDLVDGIYRLLLSNEHLPVNIGNPVETTILNFAATINRLAGNPAGVVYSPEDRMDSDPQRRRPDINRAKAILGWNPKVDIEVGLSRTIEYFKEKLGIK